MVRFHVCWREEHLSPQRMEGENPHLWRKSPYSLRVLLLTMVILHDVGDNEPIDLRERSKRRFEHYRAQ